MISDWERVTVGSKKTLEQTQKGKLQSGLQYFERRKGGGGCRYKKRGGGECATESPESLSKLSLVLIAPTAEARLGSWIALLCWP